jgi:hypothetical protein
MHYFGVAYISLHDKPDPTSRINSPRYLACPRPLRGPGAASAPPRVRPLRPFVALCIRLRPDCPPLWGRRRWAGVWRRRRGRHSPPSGGPICRPRPSRSGRSAPSPGNGCMLLHPPHSRQLGAPLHRHRSRYCSRSSRAIRHTTCNENHTSENSANST